MNYIASRRDVLKGGGALVVSFSLAPVGDALAQRATKPVALTEVDSFLAIDPKGYAGDAYRGCYFWDTEMYLLPFYLYTDLPRARLLLEYRIRSLPGARSNAASMYLAVIATLRTTSFAES